LACLDLEILRNPFDFDFLRVHQELKTDKLNRRFYVENKTALDCHTGLMWSLDASLTEFPMTWSEAFDFVGNMNQERYENYGNWRLPNRRELLSLISYDLINPALPSDHPFENVFHGCYWTASTSARLPRQAWYIHFGGARVYRGIKNDSYMVWPVRSVRQEAANVYFTGQHTCYDDMGNFIPCNIGPLQHRAVQAGIEWPKPRFDVTGDTVTDYLSGLTWTRNTSFSKVFINWNDAAQLIQKMNTNMEFGFDDWRIPHIQELESLIDLGTHSPALPVDHSFTNIQDFYWSGTTSVYEPRYAWALYMKDGALGVGYKANPEFFLWPVRGYRHDSRELPEQEEFRHKLY
jgi:hypothetical protein